MCGFAGFFKAAGLCKSSQVLRVKMPAEGAGEFEVTALQAAEIDPPASKNPLEWVTVESKGCRLGRCLSTLVDWYRCRWEIEMFFNIL